MVGEKWGFQLPYGKKFLSETKSGVVNQTWWPYDFAGSTRNANAEIKSLFDGVKVFDTPKPTKLIVRLISMITNKDSLVMDFFAGSGTTGHAVYLKNKEDGGNRNYILIQLPEMISPDNKEQKTLAEFCTNNGLNLKISELTKERLRRAGKKFVKTIQNGMVMSVFVCLNLIHLIFVRGKPPPKHFHNSLMLM